MFIPNETTALKDVLTHYVATISVQKRSYKTEVYRIKALTDILGEHSLGEVTPAHVAAFRDKRLSTLHPRTPGKTVGPATVKLELMLLSHVFSIAITEWGLDHLTNPVLKIRKPKTPPGRSRRLSPVEERKILRAAIRHPNHELYAIIVLALETAMRQGEILALRWENVSWKKRTVFLLLTKNGDAREVPLSRAAYAILCNHMTPAAEGRVFSYSTAGLKSSWRSFILGLGIQDLHFHDLRHSSISSLMERGLNTMEVASISGHKSMAMLKRYTHLFAYKLVDKLDPKPRIKRDRPILRNQLLPYPALITRLSHNVVVDFPDFLDIRVSGREEEEVIEKARSKLLHKVVSMLCDGYEPPVPSMLDTLEPSCSKTKIEMISPLYE